MTVYSSMSISKRKTAQAIISSLSNNSESEHKAVLTALHSLVSEECWEDIQEWVEAMTKGETPKTFAEKFKGLKSQHSDAVLMFREGNVYSMYEEDALIARDVLGLTVKMKKTDPGIRQTGFPYHALDTYLPRLIRAGHRIAICDELKQGRAAQ